MAKLLLCTLVLVLLILGLLIWMAAGIQSPGKQILNVQKTLLKKPKSIIPNAIEPSNHITVITWNIAWGRGLGSAGEAQAPPRSLEEIHRTIQKIAHLIAEEKSDIALLQEVDFDSTRSGRQAQAEAIAQHSGLKYLCQLESWKANYLPFPYWPPTRHWGRIRSGGAILSRYPLKRCQGTLFPKPAGNMLYNLGYPFRYVQQCHVQLPNDYLVAVNTHLEAYNTTNRNEQAFALTELTKSFKNTPLILGGDFNSIPPNAPIRSNFPDEPEQNYENEAMVSTFMNETHLSEVLLEKDTPFKGSALTYPADKPNRRLDYIFFNSSEWTIENARVVERAATISDHLPIVTTLKRKRI